MRWALVTVVALASGVARAESSEDEVTVRGSRPADSRSLGRAEVREVPGAFGDPFRAIEALPGVTPLVSGSPYFYVRGAPPGNVGYFVDGVRVPYLFHVLLGPSVVNPALVSRVELWPGAAPVRYGRFAGGIVGGSLAPPADQAHGEAVLRLFDAGGLVETPFAGGRGVALVGGRYSYSALALSLLSPSVSLNYWDYQLRIAYRVTAKGTVSVLVFGAHDFLGDKQPEGTKSVFDGQFHRIDLRYDEDHGDRGGHSRVALTLGYDRSGTTSDRQPIDRLVALRSLTTLPVGKGHVVTFGADASLDAIRGWNGTPSDNPTTSLKLLLTSRRDLSLGAHGEIALALGPVTLTPGLRVDLYGSTDLAPAPPAGNSPDLDSFLARSRDPVAAPALVAVEPRLAARVQASRRVRVFATAGVAHQAPWLSTSVGAGARACGPPTTRASRCVMMTTVPSSVAEMWGRCSATVVNPRFIASTCGSRSDGSSPNERGSPSSPRCSTPRSSRNPSARIATTAECVSTSGPAPCRCLERFCKGVRREGRGSVRGEAPQPPASGG